MPPRIALYTAIIGAYDQLKAQPATVGIDWYCFTDQPLISGQYRIISTPDILREPILTSRIFKMLPHIMLPDYDITIWHDASIQFRDGAILERLATEAGQSTLAVFRHPDRDCIYEEAQWCIDHGKDEPERINAQVGRLRAAGYPPHQGLANCGLIARNNRAPQTIRFNEAWWEAYQNGSRRDQLSFNFISWRHTIPFTTLPINIYDNPYLKVLPHLK